MLSGPCQRVVEAEFGLVVLSGCRPTRTSLQVYSCTAVLGIRIGIPQCTLYDLNKLIESNCRAGGISPLRES